MRFLRIAISADAFDYDLLASQGHSNPLVTSRASQANTDSSFHRIIL
jgi:hypothetical protein